MSTTPDQAGELIPDSITKGRSPREVLETLYSFRDGFIKKLGPGGNPSLDELELIWERYPRLIDLIKQYETQLGIDPDSDRDYVIEFTPEQIAIRERFVARLRDPVARVDELDELYAQVRSDTLSLSTE